MHIQTVSVIISQESLNQVLKNTKLPEGITYVDSILSDNTIVLVLRMASYFGIPVKIKLEFHSFDGSRIFFKAKPPIRFSMAGSPDLPSSHECETTSLEAYTLAEIDLVKLSKGKLVSATITGLSISKAGIVLNAENIRADWQGVFPSCPSSSANHK